MIPSRSSDWYTSLAACGASTSGAGARQSGGEARQQDQRAGGKRRAHWGTNSPVVAVLRASFPAVWSINERRGGERVAPSRMAAQARRWQGWPRCESYHPRHDRADSPHVLALLLATLAGCHHPFPITGNLRTESGFQGTVDVRIPPATDPGPMVPTIVRASPCGPGAARVALVDVDGLILNQNLTGLYSVGENPVSAFREKLEAAAADPRVRAVVLRINSPGGGVAASDLLAEELRRFRQAMGKPVVACLMDVATGGAYYLAVGCDRVVALPTSITGGVVACHPRQSPGRDYDESESQVGAARLLQHSQALNFCCVAVVLASNPVIGGFIPFEAESHFDVRDTS